MTLDNQTIKINGQSQISDYLKYKKNRKAEVVIYTAFTENYDNLINHTYISKNFDYVCFTDKKIKKPGIWETKKITHKEPDPNRIAKAYKILPHKYLSKYKYSIWIDSSINITSDKLEKRVNELIKWNKKLSIHAHSERNCVYQEARVCIDLQKDDPSKILKEVAYLKKQKYPINNGLHENNIIFREHNNPMIIKLMEDWWWMIENFSRRDQLSFDFVLWKSKLKCTPLFPQNAKFMTDDFDYREHNTKIVSTLFISTGKGFSEDNFIQKLIIISKNKYRANFDLSNYKNINQIKLNPLKNQLCKFEISKFKLDGKVIPISKFKISPNGKTLNDSIFDFSNTSNPEIILSINKEYKKIEIYGTIHIYNLEDLIKHTKKLQEELNKIKSSKTYMLWQKYNDIKKYFRKYLS